MIRLVTPEDHHHYACLTQPGTADGTATARYAAAMHFFMRGMISAETLEVYRTCSPLDGEDPRNLLLTRGLAEDILLDTEEIPCAP